MECEAEERIDDLVITKPSHHCHPVPHNSSSGAVLRPRVSGGGLKSRKNNDCLCIGEQDPYRGQGDDEGAGRDQGDQEGEHEGEVGHGGGLQVHGQRQPRTRRHKGEVQPHMILTLKFGDIINVRFVSPARLTQRV